MGSSANLAFWKASQPRPLRQLHLDQFGFPTPPPLVGCFLAFHGCSLISPSEGIQQRAREESGSPADWGGETEAHIPGHSDWPI